MRFILRGKAYDLAKVEVEEKMEGITPEVIHKYYVVVNGKNYPPKQVLGEILRLSRVEFTTMDATNVLRRLFFELGQL